MAAVLGTRPTQRAIERALTPLTIYATRTYHNALITKLNVLLITSVKVLVSSAFVLFFVS